MSPDNVADRKPISPKAAPGGIPPSLPPSVEAAYKKKCIELKQRMDEVELDTDARRLRRMRLQCAIRKMRLERAILLQALAKRMRKNGAECLEMDDASEDSSEGPPTVSNPPSPYRFVSADHSSLQPQEKPLRSKRGHRRNQVSPGLNAAPTAASAAAAAATATANHQVPLQPAQPRLVYSYAEPEFFQANSVPSQGPFHPIYHTNGASGTLPTVSPHQRQHPQSAMGGTGLSHLYNHDSSAPEGGLYADEVAVYQRHQNGREDDSRDTYLHSAEDMGARVDAEMDIEEEEEDGAGTADVGHSGGMGFTAVNG